MLSDSERKAIQIHTAHVEEYHARLHNELMAVMEPYHKALRELRALRESRIGPPIIGEVRDTPRGCTDEEDKRVVALHQEADRKLTLWHQVNPAPKLDDTPDLIIYDIQMRIAARIDGRSWARAQIEARNPNWSDADRHAFIESVAVEEYRQVRSRVLAFRDLAPSAARDPLVCSCADPVVGIQNLREWCEEAMRPLLSPSGAGEPDKAFARGEWTLTEAAKVYAKQAEIEFATAKTRLDRACRRDDIRHRGAGRDKRLCRESAAFFMLQKIEPELDEPDDG